MFFTAEMKGLQEVFMPVYRVYHAVFAVGGEALTHPLDSNIYLVRGSRGVVLIDAGTGEGWENLVRNILELGVDLREIKRIALTHCHVSNAGGAEQLRRITGGMVVAHEPDATILRRGDPNATLAAEHGIRIQPVVVGYALRSQEASESIAGLDVSYLHTPGHTPGSMSIWIDLGGNGSIVFVGDAFGPLSDKWGSSEEQWRKSLETIHGLDFNVLCSSRGCVEEARAKGFIEEALSMGAIWI